MSPDARRWPMSIARAFNTDDPVEGLRRLEESIRRDLPTYPRGKRESLRGALDFIVGERKRLEEGEAD